MGRSIYNAVRNIYDVMAFTQDEDLPGLLVALDIEKAFDSLSRKFLSTVLEKLNFGPSFIRWVRTFYINICSCIMLQYICIKLFSH